MKQNQQLKYLNKGSCHTPACFKATPYIVFQQLGKLTTLNEDMADMSLEDFYPIYIDALKKANLLSENIPTLKETLETDPIKENKKKR